MSEAHHIGQRVSFDGALCTVRYVGDVAGTSGTWLGVEWDEQGRGKHDGSHKGVRYFSCLSKTATAASFVRPTRPADTPQSFVAALHEKYASGDADAKEAPQIVISGKVAQEMGFDKIRRQQAQVHELKIVIVDSLRILTSRDEGEQKIGELCPKIVQLDLGRNLFEHFGPVVEVCRQLPGLRILGLSGNRFRKILEDTSLDACGEAFEGIEELSVQESMLSWSELCHIASKFTSLSLLDIGMNQLSSFPDVDFCSLATTLTTLNLEFNDITYLSDLDSLVDLQALRNLHLKGNNIIDLASPEDEALVFSKTIQFLDVSYNNIEDWTFVDNLPTHFPGLTSLRLAHNPVYDASSSTESKASSSEESYMITIARLAELTSLNFSQVTAGDRRNAEMLYLSRIAKQLASVPESAEEETLLKHPRYTDLCNTHGEPAVIRRDEVNPSFLEARLITVSFHSLDKVKRTSKIPKSFDIYAVKGIAGRLFGLSPLKLRLVWETGEWDPVAGFYEAGGDSSDEEGEKAVEVDVPQQGAGDSKTGRWIKREQELRDGPRQLGYCVDGLDVTIRVGIE